MAFGANPQSSGAHSNALDPFPTVCPTLGTLVCLWYQRGGAVRLNFHPLIFLRGEKKIRNNQNPKNTRQSNCSSGFMGASWPGWWMWLNNSYAKLRIDQILLLLLWIPWNAPTFYNELSHTCAVNIARLICLLIRGGSPSSLFIAVFDGGVSPGATAPTLSTQIIIDFRFVVVWSILPPIVLAVLAV